MTNKLAAKLQTMLFVQKDKGATAVEYGLIVAAIAAVIVALVFLLGTQVQEGFKKVSDAFTAGGLTGTP